MAGLEEWLPPVAKCLGLRLAEGRGLILGAGTETGLQAAQIYKTMGFVQPEPLR